MYIVGLSRQLGVCSRQNLRYTPSKFITIHNSSVLSNPALRAEFSTSPRRLITTSSRIEKANGKSLCWVKATGIASIGLGLSIWSAPRVYCEPVTPRPVSQPSQAAPHQAPEPLPPPPSSGVHYLELTFGTVVGICAGVFVKKGAKAVAFVLGGVFVLLQYLGSLSLVRVDWTRAATRFQNLFYTKDATGQTRPPNVGSLFRWLIDFLTADFQQRASFVAGFALGLRVG